MGRHDQWLTVEAGVWYENARFKHCGERMRLLDVCKMLAGKTKAIANTDVPTSRNWDPATGWEYNLVTCLRLDVDMERSWRRRDLNAIAQQVRAERACARCLGLPYRCFRTGRKGHQIVIPLPVPTPHLLAWWWMIAFKTLLGNNLHPDATLDKDNLTSLLRLPGGLHQDQQRLALWIDADTMRLHDIETQARLMGDGFRYPDEEDSAYIPPCEFHRSGREVLAALAERDHDKHYVPGGDRQDLFFGVVEDLPVNVAVRVFLHALDAMAITADEVDGDDDFREIEAQDAAAFSKAVTDGTAFDLEWARRVVADGFSPGEFWEWLSMEGRRGILALWLVYGKDAEKEAIAMANSVTCRSEAERRKRVRTIKSYWKRFQIKDGENATGPVRRAPAKALGNLQAITGDLSPDGLALAASLGQTLQATGKVQTRNLDALVNAVHVVILAMQQSTNGHIQLVAEYLGARGIMEACIGLYRGGIGIIRHDLKRAPGELGMVGTSSVGTWSQNGK